MLQLDSLSKQAHEMLADQLGFPPSWEDMAGLEHVCDDWVTKWLQMRRKLARDKGVFAHAGDSLDRWIRTNKPEYLDDPDCPVKKKIRIVRGVHWSNVLYFSYSRYVKLLTPLIREVADHHKRPTRLLELASGSGGLAQEIYRRTQEEKLSATITGSDVVPKYVEQAKVNATKQGLEMDFRVVNAFGMQDLEPGEFDIIFISQSTHHFTPGQLAMMIAQARRVATTAFVSIDGKRSLHILLGISVFPALTLQFSLLHDGWISARKFFSRYELEHIPLIAAPGAEVSMANIWPMNCVTVRFDRSN